MPSTDFRPFPFLANPHVQTIVGNLWPTLTRPPIATIRTVTLDDGDRIALHDNFPDRWEPGNPWVLLLHGLGGCHASPYSVRIARRLLFQGVAVSRMDLRGAGAGLALARRVYCAACSDDVDAVVRDFSRRHPGSAIGVAGFSLSGNIVLKWAAEHVDIPHLAGVVAVAPPADLVRCAKLIADLPFYNRYYVRRLIEHVRRHEIESPVLTKATFPRNATLFQFDDLYTAPNWGYDGAWDYYAKASSLPGLPKITAPTLILAARDDPFVAFEPPPTGNLPANVQVRVTPYGGHMGFVGRDRYGGLRWAEAEVLHWLTSRLTLAGKNQSS